MANHNREERTIISSAVAIDKDKNSQFAVKWAIENLMLKDNRLILVHVSSQPSFHLRRISSSFYFCEYIIANSITTIVLGASSRGAISRYIHLPGFNISSVIHRAFRNADVPSSIGKSSTPTSATSSMPHNVFSPSCPDSLNSRDHLQTSPSKRLMRSKIHVQNSEESSGSIHMAQWERRNDSKNPTPGNKHSGLHESMTNFNLRVRTKETSPHSLSGSGSSNNSGVPSFPSDVSFELLDQPRSSDSTKSPKSPQAALSWSTRIRIAAEIATALNFLHQMRPEPLVHRDLKPANILLDKNFASKISDVGLSRLVPPTSADSSTQYHMTAPAGTFCYIDPEYQQTGMLGTKSDIYSLGVMLLQIMTAKPVKEVLSLAKLALNCCELRRKDRPDLESVILPELERLNELGSEVKDENRFYCMHSQDKRFGQTSPSSLVFLKGFDGTDFQHKRFQQESSTSTQETTNSNPEIQMETPRIYTSGSGSSISTTLENVD